MAESLTLKEKSLVQQGYDYTPSDLRKLDWGLRFTPIVCMLGAAYGLFTQQAMVHFVLAALGIVPFWFPAWHPVDRLYNHVIRPLINGVKLPPNPLPRRIACFMGGSMNIGIGLGFLYQAPMVAYVFGAILVPLQLVVISTHFCVASWLYEMVMKMMGRWDRPITPVEAHRLVNSGAVLVDVRGPDEFAKGHLPHAINVPLDDLVQHLDLFQKQPTVLYCQSGMRCQGAVNILKRRGFQNVYNLGAMSCWQEGDV